MRVLVLGHNGLLGNCIKKFLSQQSGINVVITNERWPNQSFIHYFKTNKFDYIINAIAKIPQSKPKDSDLFISNLGLPIFLATLGFKVIHPSSNDLSGSTQYSLSKFCAEDILNSFSNVHIIKSSIIGIEETTNHSLLSWFLACEKERIQGFKNHYWNGITTLQWSKICLELIEGKRKEKLIMPFSDTITKYDLLTLFKNIFRKDIEITPINNDVTVLANHPTNTYVGDIYSQLLELKQFYQL